MKRSREQEVVLDAAVASTVIKNLSEELSRRLAEPIVRRRYMEGDEAIEIEALTAACARAGVEPSDYRRALESDSQIADLHRAALDEAIVGTPDPGPYDQISRESPSGNEVNEHYNRWKPRGNSP